MRRLRRRGVIRQPLIAEEDVGRVAKPARNADRSAERRQQLHVAVRRLRLPAAGERERTRIPRRVAELHADPAVVERALPAPVVAERRHLRERRRGAVVDAAVHQVAVSRTEGVRKVRGVRRVRRVRRVRGVRGVRSDSPDGFDATVERAERLEPVEPITSSTLFSVRTHFDGSMPAAISTSCVAIANPSISIRIVQ